MACSSQAVSFIRPKLTMGDAALSLGVDAVRNTPNLSNANGFIEVDDGYQHGVPTPAVSPGRTSETKNGRQALATSGWPKSLNLAMITASGELETGLGNSHRPGGSTG